jgi:hypothetical protein
MVVRIRLFTLVLLLGTCEAQNAPTASVEPLELVARGEKACADADKEPAILLLWEALERLAEDADNPANATGIATALALLKANDRLEADRLATFQTVARFYADLAAIYRAKKWFDTAADRLDFADGFDRAATARERQQLAQARPKGPGSTGALSPKVALLRKAATVRAIGPWKEQGDTLECGGNTMKGPRHEWVIDALHEDCEVSVEFRGSDAKIGHNATIAVGLDGNSCYFEIIAEYQPKWGCYSLGMWEHDANAAREITYSNPPAAVTPDGFHRLTVRVRGASLCAWLDASPPLESKTSVVPRGRFGLFVGVTDQDTSPITFRNLRRRPLPREANGGDAAVQAEAQRKIGRTLSAANTMMGEKRLEPAAAMLRDAVLDAHSLPAGVLRDGFLKTLDSMLTTADSLSMRSKQAAQDSAKALLALADRYAGAHMARAAERLVRRAAEIDPDGCAARLEAAKQAVDEWQKAQGR